MHRHQIPLAQKGGHLRGLQLLTVRSLECKRLHDHKQMVAIFLSFGPMVRGGAIFDLQWMKLKLLPQQFQIWRFKIAQIYPALLSRWRKRDLSGRSHLHRSANESQRAEHVKESYRVHLSRSRTSLGGCALSSCNLLSEH